MVSPISSGGSIPQPSTPTYNQALTAINKISNSYMNDLQSGHISQKNLAALKNQISIVHSYAQSKAGSQGPWENVLENLDSAIAQLGSSSNPSKQACEGAYNYLQGAINDFGGAGPL